MPLGPGLPFPTTLLFNHPTRSIMPIVNGLPVSIDNDDEHHKALFKGEMKMIKTIILPEIILIFQKGLL